MFNEFHKEGMTIKSAKRNAQDKNMVDVTIIFDENPDYSGEYCAKLYAGKGEHTGELLFYKAGCRVYLKPKSGSREFEVVDIVRYEEFHFNPNSRRRGWKGGRKSSSGSKRASSSRSSQQKPETEDQTEAEGEGEPQSNRQKMRDAANRRRSKRQQSAKHEEWEAEDKERSEESAEPEDKTWRDQLVAFLKNGVSVYLYGPAGCGKSYAVADLCTENDWEFFTTSAVQQEFKLDGFVDAMGEYRPTEFYKAVTCGKECVFFIDEMDASIPEVLTKLNMALANGYHEFPEGEDKDGNRVGGRIEIDLEKVHFVAAGNTLGNGADDLYTGRMVLDTATLNRFAPVRCDYERDVEVKLAKGDTDLVDFIEGLRKAAETTGIRAVFSYRQIIYAAKMRGILNRKQIVETVIVGGMDKDTMRTLYTFEGGAWCEAFEQVKAA